MASAAKTLGVVIDHDDKEINVEKLFKGKIIGLYFSAHWCRTCQGFLPILKDFYKQYHESKNFEIVFISVDKDKESFLQHFDEMPWFAKAYITPKDKVCSFDDFL
jgi:nucleoredoxin